MLEYIKGGETMGWFIAAFGISVALIAGLALAEKLGTVRFRPYFSSFVSSLPFLCLIAAAVFYAFRAEQAWQTAALSVACVPLLLYPVYRIIMRKPEHIVLHEGRKYLAVVNAFGHVYVDLFERYGLFTLGERAYSEEYAVGTGDPYSFKGRKRKSVPEKVTDFTDPPVCGFSFTDAGRKYF